MTQAPTRPPAGPPPPTPGREIELYRGPLTRRVNTRVSRPPGLLGRLAGVIVGRPRRVLGAIVLLAVVLGGFGFGVVSQMTNQVGDPQAESVRANDLVVKVSGASAVPNDAVLLVDLPATWPAQEAQDRVAAVTTRLQDLTGISSVISPAGIPPGVAMGSGLISSDGRTAKIAAVFDSDVDRGALARSLLDEFADPADSDVSAGGVAIVELDIDDRIAADLTRAEVLAFPILLILGFWIFRGVIAALVPLGIGVLAILCTLGGLRLAAEAVPVSEYVLNLIVGLGLGLAIDYCLFVVSRYREEILVDGYGAAAVVRTVVKAGHTVLFSAATVALALSTLLLFPQQFLYSMGIGGVLITLAAALLSVTVLPVMLILLGPRIDSLALPRWKAAREAESADVAAGRWYALSRFVMRYAATVFPLALLLAALLAYPALSTTFGDVDETSLPTSSAPRQVSDRLATEFPDGANTLMYLAVTAPQDQATAVSELAREASLQVRATLGTGTPSYVGEDLWVVPLGVDASTFSSEARDAVEDLRGLDTDLPYLVGGDAASFDDLEGSIGSHLPWALLIVTLAVLAVMFLLTRSVVLSIKTLLLNALNVAMTFGVLVWIFEYGHLEWLLGFESTGRIDLMQPILVAIIAFGLSTDYGVFLFARIMEAHDEGKDDVEAVSQGVGRSGRIISSAALLLCIAIGAFSTSSILFIKQLGVGAAVAVFLDATLVRAFLVPSAMKLMGSVNWWSPKWLLRLVGKRRLIG